VENTSVPHTVPNLSAKAVTAGNNHTCVLLTDNTVKCWGNGDYGQLGNNQNSNSVGPVAVSDLNDVAHLAAGRNTTCAVLTNGSVKCWGENGWGQIDPNAKSTVTTPWTIDLGEASGAKGVTTGSHTCALMVDGTVQCWGLNTRYQCGVTDEYIYGPMVVSGLANVQTLSAGIDHTCALLNDGTVRCWGANQSGQLGDGSTVDQSATPVEVKFP
jgi:alpha-tubulin suppressor-like RCC1 family protein